MHDQATKLRELIINDKPLNESDANRPRRVIVAGAKGGVGTSTIALNLAVSAQYQGQRVLLIDADSDCGDLATLCDVSADFGLEDVLQSRRDWNAVMVVGPAGISFVPRVGDFTAEVPSATPSAIQLSRKLDCGLSGFDLIVLDAGRHLQTTNSSPIANEALLVMTHEHVALKNAYLMMKDRAAAYRDLPTVVMNRITDMRTAHDAIARLATSCERFLGMSMAEPSMIADDESLRSTLAPSRPVACSNPNASVARTLARLAKQISEERPK